MVGQIASPIQSHWLLSQVRLKAPGRDGFQARHLDFLDFLISDHASKWTFAHHWAPTEHRLEDLDSASTVSVWTHEPCRVLDFQKAEAAMNHRLIQVQLDDRVCKHDELLPLHGSFSSILVGSGPTSWDQLILQHPIESGLDDLTMLRQARLLTDRADLPPSQLLAPRLLAVLLETTSSQATLMLKDVVKGNGPFLCLHCDDHHWILLIIESIQGQWQARVYDSIHLIPTDDTLKLISLFAAALDLHHLPHSMIEGVRQLQGHHCGTLCLMELGRFLGLFARVDESTALLWHQQLYQRQRFHGSGGSEEEAIITWLTDYLPAKGVDPGQARARAQSALKLLGKAPLAEAIKAKDAWRALKQLGNSKSKPFQWVTYQELHQHITSRAKVKHGATLSSEKKRYKARAPEPDLQLVPESLRIAEGLFFDDDEKAVNELPFQKVQSDSRGIAICLPEQAAKLAMEEMDL